MAAAAVHIGISIIELRSSIVMWFTERVSMHRNSNSYQAWAIIIQRFSTRLLVVTSRKCFPMLIEVHHPVSLFGC